MTPITDPNLISQLEGGQQTSAMQPVTDPNLIAQLEGNTPQLALSSNGTAQTPFYQRILPDMASGLLNSAQGINQTLNNAIVNPVRSALGLKGQWQSPQYNWNQTLGAGNTLPDQLIQGTTAYAPFAPLADVAPAMGPLGEGLNAIGGRTAPYAAKAAQYLAQSPKLANALNQVAPTSLFGSLQNPSHPATGAAEGAFSGFAAAGLPSIIGNTWNKLSSTINPDQHAENMLQYLSGGNSVSDNAKSLALSIRNAFNNQKANASALYNPIFDNFGNASIYHGIDPLSTTYPTLNDKVIQNYTPDLNDLHNAFTNDPTLQNAHNLQSQLGASIRDYEGMAAKGNLNTADRITMQNYQRAQNAVQSDIGNFLDTQQPGLSSQYEAANQNYAANVAPYKSNSQLAQIATGSTDYPKSISGLFAKPNADIQKVAQDLGPTGANQVLFDKLGMTSNSATPEKLSKALGNLDQQGLGQYVSPQLQSMSDALNQKISNKNTALKLGGLVGGGVLAHSFGAGESGVPEFIGSMLGTKIIPPVVRGLQNILPIRSISNSLSNNMPNIYGPLSRAYVAQSLMGGNQNGGS